MTVSIRVRLTLWYVVMLACAMLVFAAGVYALIAREQQQSIDRLLSERAAAFARSYAVEADELSTKAAVIEAMRNFSAGNEIFVYSTKPLRLVSRSAARLIGVSDALSVPKIRRIVDRAMSGRPQFVSLDDEVRCIVAPIDHRYVFVSTQSMAAEEQTLTRVRSAFALAIPTVLILAAVGGYLLTRRTLGPIARITETASRIEAENLSERIAVGHEDELGRLAAVLNALLDRLERSFHQQKQLLADTSHELRTPVTIIRSEAEVTLSRERSADEYRNALESIRSESIHLTNLIEGVLMLARADARQMHIAKRQFSLREVVEQAVQTARTLARARGVDLSAVTDGAMPLRGEAELIRRMLLNLLDNAVKFTEPGGRVSVDAQQDGANYTITVTDSGCGIAAEDQEQIFDRFFRGDRARRRDLDGAPGTGLGLSIVKWIAEAHGGTVRLVRSNAAGSTFEVALPAIAADA